jgi:poly-gamma-glutamate capsule biosynthesis protein CapA/YwtB (metallophosphatase superfamily)
MDQDEIPQDATRRQKAPRGFALALLMVLLALLAISWRQAATTGKLRETPSYPKEISRITFAAAGDVIPHQAVVQAATAQQHAAAVIPPVTSAGSKEDATSLAPAANGHDGWDALFAGVADVFQGADFGFVNLETPVAPVHSRGTKAFQFNAPLDLVESLKFSGIKIVSSANNHVFDQGYSGFAETLQSLRQQGILFVGAGDTAEASWTPVIIEKNGIKVGWLGMTRWLNGGRNPEKEGEPHVAFFPYPGESLGAAGSDEAAVLEAIKAARAQCDLLLVSIHWGMEYAAAPRPEDVDVAHDMLEAGASAVIGHHPHVLQPIETYLTRDQRSTIVAYSLGNFLSNQSSAYVNGLTPDKTGEPRDSIIIKLAAVKKDYGPAGIRVELGDVGIMPIWTENNRLLIKNGRTKVLSIRPVFIDREIARLQAQYDELSHLGPQLSSEQKQEYIQVSNQLQMLQHRRELLLARTGDEFLVAPPAPQNH